MMGVVAELREPAYQCWVYECRGDMQCVHGRYPDVTLKTLYEWKSKYKWTERKQRELIPELYNMMTDIKTDVSLAMKDVVPALLGIVLTSPDDGKVISASRALNEVYRTLVLSTVPQPDVSIVDAEYRTTPALTDGQPDYASVVDILEANVSENERKRPNHR